MLNTEGHGSEEIGLLWLSRYTWTACKAKSMVRVLNWAVLVFGSTVYWTVTANKITLFLLQLCSVCTAACVVFKCPQKSYSLTHPSPHCSGVDKLCFIAGSLVGVSVHRTLCPHLDTHWHDEPKPSSGVLIYIKKMCRVIGGKGSANILVFVSLAGGFPNGLGEL